MVPLLSDHLPFEARKYGDMGYDSGPEKYSNNTKDPIGLNAYN